MFSFVSQIRSEPLKPLIFLLLVFLCANSIVFFMGRTLIPLAPAHGVLSPAPYGYRGPWTADSPITRDAGGAFNGSYAFDAYTVRSLKQGFFPFWNPYQGLGQPFLANSLSAVLYPANWLMLILPPAWWDMIWLLHWLLAAQFFYLYLSLLGIEPIFALLGGVGILSSGYFQMNLALREVPAVAAWWPLLLYAVERTLQAPTWRHRHWVLALAVYCSVTGGQPEVTFLSLFTVLLYALIRLTQIKEHRWKTLRALIPGSLGGLLLAAPLWVNFAAYAFPAYSLHGPDCKLGLGYNRYTNTTAFLFPYIYGFSVHNSPTWVPVLLIFSAFVSLGGLRRHSGRGQLFFTILAFLMLAKFCGAPGINRLGSLPLFARINFEVYAGFLLTFAVCGMAVYGLAYLAKLEPRRWQNWLAGWSVFCLVGLIIGIRPLWPQLQKSGVFSGSAAIFATFGGRGLAWAIIAPLALFWLRWKRPDENNLFYLLTGFGILWQGIAYAPQGSQTITSLLSLLYLLIFLLTAILAARPNVVKSYKKMAIYGLIIAALPQMVSGFFFTSQGLPKRYDPLTPPPYLRQLQTIQENGVFRSYSFDSAPAPNFAAPFGLSSLGVLEPLSPIGSAAFISTYLDRGVNPLYLAGNRSFYSFGSHDSMAELRDNLRYFSLVSTKFILGQDSEPLTPPYYDTDFWHYTKDTKLLIAALEFSLVSPADTLSRVDVLIHHNGSGSAGLFTLRIFGPDGSLRGTANLPGETLKGKTTPTFLKFYFSPLTGLENQKIRLQMSFTPGGPGPRPSAYFYPKAPEIGFACRLFSGPGTPAIYPLVYEDPDTKVKIWENPGATPRLFLAPAAGVARSWEDALARLKDTPDLNRQVWLVEGPPLASSLPSDLPTGKILSFHLDPNDVLATFEAYTPGILTLTDSYSPGWRAYLNGQEVPILLVDGVFRGVRLHTPGTYELKYSYRPPYWHQSLAMAIIGILLACTALISSVKR
jgi:hypothetical protein